MNLVHGNRLERRHVDPSLFENRLHPLRGVPNPGADLLRVLRVPELDGRLPALLSAHGAGPKLREYVAHLVAFLRDPTYELAPEDLLVDVAPKPHHSVALEALESERRNGHRRDLVIAATVTGKTWIAAFDFTRLQNEGKGNSLLFVAHRDETLRQSQQVFQFVLREPGFGERFVDGELPRSGRHVSDSVQSLANHIDDIEPDGFDVIIVDEFHHAGWSLKIPHPQWTSVGSSARMTPDTLGVRDAVGEPQRRSVEARDRASPRSTCSPMAHGERSVRGGRRGLEIGLAPDDLVRLVGAVVARVARRPNHRDSIDDDLAAAE